MRCDLRTVKHTLQNVYPFSRSVRSVRIDTWLIQTVTMRVYWTTLQFSYPIVVVEGQGCRELSSLPIATVNVMATNDHGQNWRHDHLYGECDIWHDCCARKQACQMSGWLCRHSNVLPTLSQVNAQRVLWQKQCDRLLDQVLCNHCIDDKDDAFAQGKGLDWIPDNSSECRTVRHIFAQSVTHRK